MIFGLFGSKEKKLNISSLLADYIGYQQILADIAKVQSLRKLERIEEANLLSRDLEKQLIGRIARNIKDKNAHMLLALVYTEIGPENRAQAVIEKILGSFGSELKENEREVLSAELHKIRRERPIEERSSSDPDRFSEVFCCQNCGRLNNHITIPCPYCNWSAQSVDQLAIAVRIATGSLTIPQLLVVTREMTKGRKVDDIIPNLKAMAKEALADSEERQLIEKMFKMLQKDKDKYRGTLSAIRKCLNCGERILLSGHEECQKCETPTNWPDAIKALVCFDNLLFIFETRITIQNTPEFSEFVSVVVRMAHNLFRKQETPSKEHRMYALELLKKIKQMSDVNRGCITDLKDPTNPESYIVTESCKDENDVILAYTLAAELKSFSDLMRQGIRT